MATEKDLEKKGGAKAAEERRERLAAELRANLLKRKARTRPARPGDAGDTKKPG